MPTSTQTALTAILLTLAASVSADEPALAFHGYLRTGLGGSEAGANQASFQAPGAPSKYRLGNEADTVIELEVDYRQPLEENRYVQIVFMESAYAPMDQSNRLSLDQVAQSYVSFGNMLGEGDQIWLGRRYYQRKDIHMNDHFWLNPGQGAHAGAGIENWAVAGQRLSVALFRLEDQGQTTDAQEQTVSAPLNTSVLDGRLAMQPGSDQRTFTAWGQLAQRAQSTALALEAQDGQALGGWWDEKDLLGGSNTLALTWRRGATMVQGTTNARTIREQDGYDLEQAQVFEINNNYVHETDTLAFQWALIWREEQFGRGGSSPGSTGERIVWTSTGIRPIWFWSRHFNIATELGYDHVDNQRIGRTGAVTKATLALQLAAKPGYYARPVLRAFVTYARWSDSLRGYVGGDSYRADAQGWSLGAQAEWWW